MRFRPARVAVVLAIWGLLGPSTMFADTVILFQNNFETPTGIVIPFGCCGDASQQQVT